MRLLTNVLIILLLFSSASLAGKSDKTCKKVKIEVDDFGKSTKEGSQPLNGNRYSFNLKKSDADYTLTVTLSILAIVDAPIPSGSTIMFALQDKSVIEVQSTADAAPVKKAGSTYLMTKWHVPLPSEETDLQKFLKSPIKAMRYTINGDEETVKVSEKNGSKILDMVTCILN